MDLTLLFCGVDDFVNLYSVPEFDENLIQNYLGFFVTFAPILYPCHSREGALLSG